MSSPKPLRVAIVGGGISGICLAIGLLEQPQLELTIFEASPAFTEIGAGLALGPNAQRALKLLSPAAEAAFWHFATGNSSPKFSKTWFSFRWQAQGHKDGLELGSIENQSGQQTVHRAKFLDALLNLVPKDKVHFGRRLLRISEHGAHTMLHFADGTAAKTDCVIGADGVHSTVRKHLLGATSPEATPVFSGIVAYRGLIPMEIARQSLGKYASDAYIWCSNEGMVMSYPINFGQVVNVVAACYRETWNEKVENVAVIGDAAHATTPFQGAGAGQAIEDALILSQLLGRVQCIHEIAPAFAAYNTIRRLRTERVIQTSREAMKLYTLADNVETWKQAWDGRMNWIWDIDLEAHIAEALEMLRQND
ncbi:mannitol 1-phosphate dehydrogenase [Fusarium sp. NRRL 52700]|nr:mannitol 1-phosphate dehydrogenase [Fusarium sp. NRRL 52700]